MTLREVLIEAATGVEDDVVAVDLDGGTSWSAAGVVFAGLDRVGTTASFRLDPVLAGAARRTPDVGSSPGGPEWVTFRPSVLDGHAADRAAAWFVAALRRVASRAGTRT